MFETTCDNVCNAIVLQLEALGFDVDKPECENSDHNVVDHDKVIKLLKSEVKLQKTSS